MIKYIKATDLNGNPKYLEGTHLQKCPYGSWLFPPKEDCPILFVYNDDSGSMLKSSKIEDIKRSVKDNEIRYKITTRNTIYYFIEYEISD